MIRPHLALPATAVLLIASPYVAVNLLLPTPQEDRLLDLADRLILRLDQLQAAHEDLEPEEDDDALTEASAQPVLLCPDVLPVRRARGGRT